MLRQNVYFSYAIIYEKKYEAIGDIKHGIKYHTIYREKLREVQYFFRKKKLSNWHH